VLGVWKNAGRSFCHLSTGFIGTKTLMLALAKIGRNPDTGFGAGAAAYRLIHNDTFPSWGFSIKHGATSIWERWNGWTPETGFGDLGMNSFAHDSFGAVYQWMVENIGGIRNGAHSSPHAPREVHSSHGNGHHAERD
jgi:alpha-L-rhamnosidase